MRIEGKVTVISGDGKGKTTTALGMACSVAARGKRALVMQFLKAPDTSGEHFSARGLGDRLGILPVGRKGFIGRSGPKESDIRMADEALGQARRLMESGEYDLIVLDEINVAASMGLVSVDAVLDLIELKPAGVDLVLTGRGARPDVVDAADYVLEMRKVKHPFDKGIGALEGIEY